MLVVLEFEVLDEVDEFEKKPILLACLIPKSTTRITTMLLRMLKIAAKVEMPPNRFLAASSSIGPLLNDCGGGGGSLEVGFVWYGEDNAGCDGGSISFDAHDATGNEAS